MNVLDYYMDVAVLASKRSTCLRRHIGAVAVQKDRIVASGYNGVVSKAPHCTVCLRDTLKIPSGKDSNTCFAVHAEMNLLVQASLHGIKLEGSAIYVTNKPCFTCMKLLASIQPTAIIYEDDYPDEMTATFLSDNNWAVIKRNETFTGEGREFTILLPQVSKARPLIDVLKGIPV